jgi:hypothetical protein
VAGNIGHLAHLFQSRTASGFDKADSRVFEHQTALSKVVGKIKTVAKKQIQDYPDN